jgi:hypothetical protein
MPIQLSEQRVGVDVTHAAKREDARVSSERVDSLAIANRIDIPT